MSEAYSPATEYGSWPVGKLGRDLLVCKAASRTLKDHYNYCNRNLQGRDRFMFHSVLPQLKQSSHWMENYKPYFCPPVNEWPQQDYLNCCLCFWTTLLTHSGPTAGSHALLKQAGSARPGTGVKGQQALQVSLRWWSIFKKKMFLWVQRCLHVHFCTHLICIFITDCTRSKSYFHIFTS